jgi:hypothetical protein
MLDGMKLGNMAAGTCRTYVRSVADFSAFHGRSPHELPLQGVRDYQLHLAADGLKASTTYQTTSILRFRSAAGEMEHADLHLSIPPPLNPARKPLSWLAHDLEAEPLAGPAETGSIAGKARSCSSLSLFLSIIYIIAQ